MTDQPQQPVELLPCPLCGDRDDYNPSVSPSYGYAEPGDPSTGAMGNPAAGLKEAGRYVECDKCGCCGPTKDDEADAIAAWNTRAALSPQQPVDEGLVERVAQMLEPYFHAGNVGGEHEIAARIVAALSPSPDTREPTAAMIERVAQAIALECDIDPDVFIGMHGRRQWERQFHAQARAAIAAMQAAQSSREPTDAQIEPFVCVKCGEPLSASMREIAEHHILKCQAAQGEG